MSAAKVRPSLLQHRTAAEVRPYLLVCLLFGAALALAGANCDYSLKKISPDAFDLKLRDLAQEGRLVDVGMGEIKKTDGKNEGCSTVGLGPCLGIAIINKRTKVVYLAHHDGTTNYAKMIRDAAKEALSPDDLQVALAGGEIAERFNSKFYAEAKQNAELTHADVRKLLAEVGVKDEQIIDKVQLRPNKGSWDILVDPKKKKIYLSYTPGRGM